MWMRQGCQVKLPKTGHEGYNQNNNLLVITMQNTRLLAMTPVDHFKYARIVNFDHISPFYRKFMIGKLLHFRYDHDGSRDQCRLVSLTIVHGSLVIYYTSVPAMGP